MAITTGELLNFVQGSDITGESSYDIWKSLNPDGTEQEFLEFIKGESAYEIWLSKEGNEGKSEEEFFDSLGGAKPEELEKVLTDAKAYTDSALAGFSGDASSADKLNTNAGSTTQPVYFEDGIPKVTSYALNKTVPADAKFTDTVYTHPTSGVTAGTYKSVTVDGNGHVTAGSNPTTLSGYGITDAEAKGTATSTVNTHNTATDAHNDIRGLITGLTTRLNTLANSDDTTLDQMSEVVAYIKSNRGLIEGITTSKVSVDAIINNLTTNDSTKVLSAAQGVALKSLIDNISVTLESMGVTATATELNYVDGVTSNIQTQFNSVTARLADLEAVADILEQI